MLFQDRGSKLDPRFEGHCKALGLARFEISSLAQEIHIGHCRTQSYDETKAGAVRPFRRVFQVDFAIFIELAAVLRKGSYKQTLFYQSLINIQFWAAKNGNSCSRTVDPPLKTVPLHLPVSSLSPEFTRSLSEAQ